MDGAGRVYRLRRLAAARAPGGDQAGREHLKIDVRDLENRVCVITVTGEIDLATAPVLDREIAKRCAELPSLVVLDLRGIRFLGSSGLGSLLAARADVTAIGARLRLVCTGPTVLRPMDLTGLTELFEVYPDPRSAVRGRLD